MKRSNEIGKLSVLKSDIDSNIIHWEQVVEAEAGGIGLRNPVDLEKSIFLPTKPMALLSKSSGDIVWKSYSDWHLDSVSRRSKTAFATSDTRAAALSLKSPSIKWSRTFDQSGYFEDLLTDSIIYTISKSPEGRTSKKHYRLDQQSGNTIWKSKFYTSFKTGESDLARKRREGSVFTGDNWYYVDINGDLVAQNISA